MHAFWYGYEKETEGRERRFLVIRKMYDQEYSEWFRKILRLLTIAFSFFEK